MALDTLFLRILLTLGLIVVQKVRKQGIREHSGMRFSPYFWAFWLTYIGLPKVGLNFFKLCHARMFSCPKILFLVSLLFVALLNSIPTYLFEFLTFLIDLIII